MLCYVMAAAAAVSAGRAAPRPKHGFYNLKKCVARCRVPPLRPVTSPK